ncbi:hypothetical protein CMI41_02245 [Candidatus Pacearchaeota archaeon]|nr:hypothetical protein [Candidatus Pacearchaeota archaeon]|tara:strand:+ start:1647 stop:2246 length:600 start_codon:yes stop_codon:yes gene_type:complete
MRLQTAIDNRHSIREFEKRKVPKSVLKKLVNNAAKAPSASNAQPWRFYVISSSKKRDQIAAWTNETFKKIIKDKSPKKSNMKTKEIQRIAEKFYDNLGDAPNIILVYRKKERNEESYIRPNDISSVSAAVQNLILSAVEEKLGTCWVGTLKGSEKNLAKLLDIPSSHEIIASIIIGYPKKGSKVLLRKKKKLNEVLKFI